jgi:hypothetical protein
VTPGPIDSQSAGASPWGNGSEPGGHNRPEGLAAQAEPQGKTSWGWTRGGIANGEMGSVHIPYRGIPCINGAEDRSAIGMGFRESGRGIPPISNAREGKGAMACAPAIRRLSGCAAVPHDFPEGLGPRLIGRGRPRRTYFAVTWVERASQSGERIGIGEERGCPILSGLRHGSRQGWGRPLLSR